MSANALTSTAKEQEQFCAVCNKSTRQTCSSCKIVHYCTREHQQLHWKIHSKSCLAFEFVKNPDTGHHCIATRDIKVGELILREEKPLIEIPLNMTPSCLNCYIKLSIENAKPCTKCGWPLCFSCKSHGSECKATMKYYKSIIIVDPKNYQKKDKAYYILIVLRILALREADPKAYSRLLNLGNYRKYTSNLAPPIYFKSLDLVGNFVNRLIKTGVIGEDEISKIIGIVLKNTSGVLVPNAHRAVFDKVAQIGHNCRPNCSWSNTDNGGMVIRAVMPIRKGDHITICYVSPTLGTIERRTTLATVKSIDCTCERCSDPTEFGTMFGATKCVVRGCKGFMLPKTFLLPKDTYPDFVCLECNTSKSKLLVFTMLKLASSNCHMYDNVHACKEYIKFHKMLLHENHSCMFSVKLNLLDAMEKFISNSNVSDEFLNEYIMLSKELIALMKNLMPGEIRIRGSLLYTEHVVLMKQADRLLADRAAFTKKRKEAREALAKAHNLLRDEPITSFHGRLRMYAQMTLSQNFENVALD